MSAVIVMEEFALLVTVDSVSGGGCLGCDACEDGGCIEKLTMGEDPVEDEDPETVVADAIALEAVMGVDAAVVAAETEAEVFEAADEFCGSFPERSMSFVIRMLHILDTTPDC